MKKALMASTALVAAGFIAADASAVDVELYGQVNKAFVVYDDGQATDSTVADNDKSSTRFGFMGSQALDNGLTASVLIEGELQNNASNAFTQNQAGTDGDTASTPTVGTGSNFRERHTRVGVAGDWGAVFLGRLSSATDGVAEQDLAGAGDVLGSDVSRFGGGLNFTNDSATTGTVADIYDLDRGAGDVNITVNQGITQGAGGVNFDGNQRIDGVRYDSPIFNGFQGRLSVAGGGDVDGAVYYNGKYEEYAIKAGLGYVRYNDGTSVVNNALESQITGSVSVKHDSGIAGTFAMGERSLDNKAAGIEDPGYWYIKGGYAWDAFEVAADYGTYSDYITTQTADHEMKAMGLAGQYNLGNGVSVSGLYRNFGFESDDANLDNAEDISLYAVNLRVKF